MEVLLYDNNDSTNFTKGHITKIAHIANTSSYYLAKVKISKTAAVVSLRGRAKVLIGHERLIEKVISLQ